MTTAEHLRKVIAEIRRKPYPIADLIPLLDEAAGQLEAYQAAVGNLIKVKGRYHTEQAFTQLKTMHESNST